MKILRNLLDPEWWYRWTMLFCVLVTAVTIWAIGAGIPFENGINFWAMLSYEPWHGPNN